MEHLNSRQKLAITAIASGLSDTEAAKIASVNRSTLNQWKNRNVRFKESLAIERNIIREESIRQVVDRFRRLKEASYKTVLDGVEKGCLITARWVIEKTCLDSDLKIANEIDSLSQLQEEDIHSIMETMARDSVKDYLDNQKVDQLERFDIEESMVRKITEKVIIEFNNKESGNDEK